MFVPDHIKATLNAVSGSINGKMTSGSFCYAIPRLPMPSLPIAHAAMRDEHMDMSMDADAVTSP